MTSDTTNNESNATEPATATSRIERQKAKNREVEQAYAAMQPDMEDMVEPLDAAADATHARQVQAAAPDPEPAYVVGSSRLSVSALPRTIGKGYQLSWACPACTTMRGLKIGEDLSRFGPDTRVVSIATSACGAPLDRDGEATCDAVLTVIDDGRSVWSHVHEDDGCVRERRASWSENEGVWHVKVPRCSVCGLPHEVAVTPEQRDDALGATFNGGESPLKVDKVGMEYKATDLLLRVPVRCVTGNGDGRTTDVRVLFRHGDGPYPDTRVLDRLDSGSETAVLARERLESLARTDWADEAERRERALRKIREDEAARARLRDPFHGVVAETLTVDPPEIPLDALPPAMEAMVREVARSASTPVEIPLTFALGTLAGATLGMYEVYVDDAWDAGPSGFYVVALADPSERKSSALKHLERPLVEGVNELLAERARWVQAVEAEVEELNDELRKLRRAKKKDPAREREIKKTLREMTMPMSTEWLIDDATSEGLGVRLGEVGERAIIMNCEATAFRTLAGAYSESGGNYGLINKAFSRERHQDVRVTREGVNLRGPVITWAVAVQPGVMAGYGKGLAAESGFLPRFQPFLCSPLIGTRKAGQAPVPAIVSAEWDRRIRALFDVSVRRLTDWVENGVGEEYDVVSFAPDATAVMHAFQDDLEARKRPGRDLWQVGPWLERHPERLARLMMLFTLFKDPTARVVRVEMVHRVLRLSESLIQSGIEALALLMGSEGLSAMQNTLLAIRALISTPEQREKRLPDVTTRAVHQKLKGQAWAAGKGGAAAVREAMKGLEEKGWLLFVHVPDEERSGRGGNRREEGWLVNPALRGT